jgi:methylphosphotriester-DNA--protein-cysteine methyltransferase
MSSATRVRRCCGWPCRRSEDRVAALEEILCARLARCAGRDLAFEHAIRALSLREPPTVCQLAGSLGWSTRKLERRFAQRLGVAPKRLASILRFHRLYERLRKDARWGAVTESPYHDQSHFLKDFHAYTGLTLRAYARASDYGRLYIPAK